MRLYRVAVSVGLLLAVPELLRSQGAPTRAPLVAVTHHEGQFNGQSVKYTATVAETFLRDSAGTPVGALVTTAYVRDDVSDPFKRPVMFLFNGGPGASSTPLHFGAFGPMRRIGQGSAQQMLNNADSPLDVVDLVFIDPIGTGYSRPFPGVDGRQFWTRSSDALSVLSVLDEWLQRNGRERSPKYICGESYGTTRAAVMIKLRGVRRFDGVLLFALVGNSPGREMPYVGSLPAFATTAWFHERVPHDGRSVDQVYHAATEFARTEYVTALIKGSSLTPSDRQHVAERMSELIGLSPQLILANNLRVSKDTFMFNLLKDQGLRIGQLDGRATARLDAPKQRQPYDDPGMSYRGPTAASPPSARPDSTRASGSGDGGAPSALESYYKTTLKFPTSETYNALNLDVNSAWNYEGMDDVNPAIGDAMRQEPTMRLFWAAGYFDISTPMYAARYALDQAGIPGERITAAVFPAGHSVFTEVVNLTALSKAVRKFVAPR